jgi:hypothetical protein
MVAIVAEDLRRRSHRAEQQMQFEVRQLREAVDEQRQANLERGRKLQL